MGVRAWVAAIVVTSSAFWGAPRASAELVTVSFTGQVVYGSDYGGRFLGYPGGNLEGLRYHAAYVFDTALPQAAIQVYIKIGNGSDSRPANAGGIIVTENGTDLVTISANGGYFQNGILPYEVPDFWFNRSEYLSVTHSFIYDLPWDGASPFSMNFSDENRPTGAVRSEFYETTSLYEAAITAEAVLRPETIKVSIGSAVPEPTTWALMLLGFVGLGVASLRRNAAHGPNVAATR